MTEHTKGAAVVSIAPRQKQTQKPEKSQISVSASSPRKALPRVFRRALVRRTEIKKIKRRITRLETEIMFLGEVLDHACDDKTQVKTAEKLRKAKVHRLMLRERLKRAKRK